tara:strand:+ start:612 stop:788 length:177 start_codon:yes stop_codon:yes gene_type:complete
MGRLQRILKTLSVVAGFINIWLLGFAYINDIYDLQVLAIVNMILLSFALLCGEKDEND